MNKEYYLNNWDKFSTSYAKLNPDLAKNGILSKRALYNHYNVRGFLEKRAVENIVIREEYVAPIEETIITNKPTTNKIIILTANMFKENI